MNLWTNQFWLNISSHCLYSSSFDVSQNLLRLLKKDKNVVRIAQHIITIIVYFLRLFMHYSLFSIYKFKLTSILFWRLSKHIHWRDLADSYMLPEQGFVHILQLHKPKRTRVRTVLIERDWNYPMFFVWMAMLRS